MRRARARIAFFLLIALIAVAAQPGPADQGRRRPPRDGAGGASPRGRAGGAAGCAGPRRRGSRRGAAPDRGHGSPRPARLRQAEAATAEAAAPHGSRSRRRRRARRQASSRPRAAETMQPLLPLIERLSLFPAETLLAVPARAEDTLRGVLVLRGLAGQLARRPWRCAASRQRSPRRPRRWQAEAPRWPQRRSAQQAEAARARPADRRGRGGRRQAKARPRPAAHARRERSGTERRNAASRRERCERAKPRRPAPAEKRQRARRGSAARQRQADLERPTGAGTIAGVQPHSRHAGQLTAPVAGTIVRAWGDADGGWAGDRHFVSRAAGGAGGRACARSRGVRRPIPQLRAAVDRRLRRRLPCRARRLRHGSMSRSGRPWPPASRSASCRAGSRAHRATGPRCMSSCGATDSRSIRRRG